MHFGSRLKYTYLALPKLTWSTTQPHDWHLKVILTCNPLIMWHPTGAIFWWSARGLQETPQMIDLRYLCSRDSLSKPSFIVRFWSFTISLKLRRLYIHTLVENLKFWTKRLLIELISASAYQQCRKKILSISTKSCLGRGRNLGYWSWPIRATWLLYSSYVLK